MVTNIGSLYKGLYRRFSRMGLGKTYHQFREFTMISKEAFLSNLVLAERIRNLPGCIVECGVWRGGMIAGIAASLGASRTYYLFDSFEGLPKAKVIDGPAALSWQADETSASFYDNCSAVSDFADRAMILSGAKKYHVIPGWFNETLPKCKLDEPIALLRLDADWYESTKICLESLFDRVVPGGIIILDDYYTWDGCSRATHDFLSARSATERIQSFKQICFVMKSL